MFLDEPTTGLDPNQTLEIRNLIKSLAKDKIVLISSHILQEIEAMCNRVIILNNGEQINFVDNVKVSQLEQFKYLFTGNTLNWIPNDFSLNLLHCQSHSGWGCLQLLRIVMCLTSEKSNI